MSFKSNSTDIFNQLTEALLKIDALSKKIENVEKKHKAEIKDLKRQLKSKDVRIRVLEIENKELKIEIEKLKNRNNKDSSNSSKPSSTNGFKTIANLREKTNNNKGGQTGHEPHFLHKKQIKEMIKSDGVEHKIIEVSKKDSKKYKVKYKVDIEIKTVIYEYRYYQDEYGKYNIPKQHKNDVTYGSNIKVVSNLLSVKSNVSSDNVTSFVRDITNNKINLSKGTIVNWLSELNILLNPEFNNIKTKLMNSLFLHVDESPIKINGETYYLHNISNGTHTLQFVNRHKSKEAIEEMDFLNKYKGILIHDHYTVYYKYGTNHGECNVHILRYLKGVSDFTTHDWAKELKKLLLSMKKRKEKLILNGKTRISNYEYTDYKEKYISIIKRAKEELGSDTSKNGYYNEEKSLINRLLEYVENHLLFMKDFKIPFSNNQAERDIRPIKRKQKTGIFREVRGANNYVGIRSCISTYQKNNINIFKAITNAIEGKPILI